MSLNGLEAAEVNDAYQVALAEGGCWLLLKYIARDEVVLHGKGNGGVTETQESVCQYQDESPLYGFIHFRRRKVVLKYVPEGTSRLLQARVAVHFPAIADKFSPYDTTFAFSSGPDLKDSALSSAISLHTAGGSVKPGADLHLPEITEDENSPTANSNHALSESRDAIEPASRAPLPDRSVSEPLLKATDDGAISVAVDDIANGQSRNEQINDILSSVRLQQGPLLPSKPTPPPKDLSNSSDREIQQTPDPSERSQFLESDLLHPKAIVDHQAKSLPRVIEQAPEKKSPVLADDDPVFDFLKPKVKLGPRPSTDFHVRTSDGQFRPRSSLPVGMKLPTRKLVPGKPESEQKSAPFLAVNGNSRRGSLPVNAPTQQFSPTSASPHVFNSAKNDPASKSETKSTKMTPEKKRLMKALELRQRSQAASQRRGKDQSGTPTKSKASSDQVEATPKECPSLETKSIVVNGDTIDTSNKQILAQSSTGKNMQMTPLPLKPDVQESTEHQGVDKAKPHSEVQSSEQSPQESTVSLKKLSESLEKPLPSKPGSIDDQDEQIPRVMTDTPASPRHQQKSTPPRRRDDSFLNIPTPRSNYSTRNSSYSTISNETAAWLEQISSSAGEPTVREVLEVAAARSHSPVVFLDKKHALPPGVTVPAKLGPERSMPPMTDPADDDSDVEFGLDGQIADDTDTKSEEINLQAQTNSESSLPQQYLPRLRGADVVSDMSPTTSTSGIWHPTPPSSIATPTALPDNAGHGESHTDVMSRCHDDPLIKNDGDGAVQEALPQTVRRIHRSSVIYPDVRPSETELSNDEAIRKDLRESSPQHEKSASPQDSVNQAAQPRVNGHQKANSSKSGRSSRSATNPSESVSRDEQYLNTTGIAGPSLMRPVSPLNAATLFPPIAPPTTSPAKRQISMTSNISERIKALEQLSSRPTSPGLNQFTAQSPGVNVRERKSSLRSPSLSEKSHGSFPPPTNTSSLPMTSKSAGSSPQKPRYASMTRAQIPSRHESVSVTATIVRGTSQETLKHGQGNVRNSRLLYESPLDISLGSAQIMGPPPIPVTKRSSHAIYAGQLSTRSGSSLVVPGPQHTARRESTVSRRSAPSRMDGEIGAPRSDYSPSRDDESDSTMYRDGAKRDSRRSRLLKRMSSISAMSRRSIVTVLSNASRERKDEEDNGESLEKSTDPNLTSGSRTLESPFEEHVVNSPTASLRPTSPPATSAPIMDPAVLSSTNPTSVAVDFGDVNVQFPDTLLWKRRHMQLDDKGILVLSPPSTDKATRAITKRFAMSDFQPPCEPDPDRQELSHSIILDFKDGSTLQCACETAAGQAHILNALRAAYATYSA